MQTDSHSLSRGTQHIFDTALLPNGSFLSSERGRAGGENSRPSNTREQSHQPHRNGKEPENLDAGLPATHREHTHSLHKCPLIPPRTSMLWHRSLPQGEDTGPCRRSGSEPFWMSASAGSERDSETLWGKFHLAMTSSIQ